MKTTAPLFYTYVIEDPRKPGPFKYGNYSFEYEPLYVGKGYKDRVFSHLSNNSHNIVLKRKINTFRTLGLQPIIKMQSVRLTEKEAHTLEIKLIAKIGRYDKNLGPLCNFTDGGEGVSGYTRIFKSEEEKIKYLSNVRSGLLKTFGSWTEEERLERGKTISEGYSKQTLEKKELSRKIRSEAAKKKLEKMSDEERKKYFDNTSVGRWGSKTTEELDSINAKISDTVKSAWESGSYDSRVCNLEGQKPWDNKGNKSLACKLTWAFANKIYKQHIKNPSAKQVALSTICNMKFDLENLYGSKISTDSMGTVLKWFDDRGWDPKQDEDWLKFRKSFNKNHKSEVRSTK